MVTLGDLTATNASLSSPGFSYKINNAGTVAVAASTTGIYLSSDGIIDPADILLATHATPRLAGGAFDSENVSVAALFPGNLTPGTYYLGAIANYDGVVAESNTANNASAAVPVILGNNGDNTLIGTTGNDVIFGGAGNDTIDGGAGNDTIDGGAGNDLIILGSGSNLVDGGVGQDTVQLNYRVADINLTQTASGLWALNHGTGIDTITGVERLNFLDGRIDLLDSVTGQGYQAAYYEYHGSVYTGAHYFYTGITGQAYAGEVLTVDSVGRPLSERFTGVTGAPYSAYEYDFIGGVYSSSKFTITAVPAGATYSSYEADYAFDNAYQGAKFFFTDILGQSYTGEEVDTDVSGHATRVLLTGITGLGYSTLEEDFSGGSFSDYKAYFTGITGQSYSGLEVDVTAGNVLTRAVYTGMTGTPYSAFEQDFTDGTLTGTKFEFTNISGAPYYAYEVEQDATSAIRRETLFNSDGSHSIIGFQDNLRFTALGNDTFTGGGSGETFVLNPVFGHDTITDFYQHMTGAGHDLIQLSTSDFADFAALTNSAQDINGGVLITGLSGDTLTLIGLNKATLGGLAADFSFT